MKVVGMILFLFALGTLAAGPGRAGSSKTALVLIDIQNFYFPGGKSELVDPVPASLNARKLLDRFRATHSLIVHVRHNSEPGGEFHENVRPLEGEKVISKDDVNAFKNTELLECLKSHDIDTVVIAGMMTHMCVEAASRAAHDYDFEVIVIQDACATRDVQFEDVKVSARDVHYSTLATLSRYYGKVMSTEAYLKTFEDS